MNAGTTQESAPRCYASRRSIGAWTVFVVVFALISGGTSLAAHSVAITSGFLLGSFGLWWLLYRVLSKNCYYISATKAGYKDILGGKEVLLDEVRAAKKSTAARSSSLIFVCGSNKISMPLDPLDQRWFSDVQSELARRGITVVATSNGLPVESK